MSANDAFQQSLNSYLNQAQSVAQQGLAGMEGITEGKEQLLSAATAAKEAIGVGGVQASATAQTTKFLKEMGVDMSTKGALEGAQRLTTFTGLKLREAGRRMDSFDEQGQRVGMAEYRGPNDSRPIGVRPAEADPVTAEKVEPIGGEGPPVTAQPIGGGGELPPVKAQPIGGDDAIPPSYDDAIQTASGFERVEVEKPRQLDATPDEASLSEGRAVGQVASGEGGTDILSRQLEVSRRIRAGETFDPAENLAAFQEGRMPKSNEQIAQEADSSGPSTLFEPSETALPGGAKATDTSVDTLDEGGAEFSAPRSLTETYGGSIRPTSELPEPARPAPIEEDLDARPPPAVGAQTLEPQQPEPEPAQPEAEVKAPVEPSSVEQPPPAYDAVTKPQGELSQLKSDLGTDTKELADTVASETGEITASLGSTVLEGAGTVLRGVGGFLGDIMPFVAPIMAGVGLYEGLHDVNKTYGDLGNDPYAKVRQQVNAGQDKINSMATTISADQFASKVGGTAPSFGSLAAPTFSTAQQTMGSTGHF